MLLPQQAILYSIIAPYVKGVLPLKYGVLYAKISRMGKNDAQIMQFEKTVVNLKEVLEKINASGADRAILRDSAIKRFEIAFDICWKTLKEKLRKDFGVEENSPKKVFQEAFKQLLIENNEIWISMTDMRNETAHVYNEVFAEKMLLELPKVQVALEQLLWKLKK